MSDTLEDFGDFLTLHGAVDLKEIQTETLTRFAVDGDKGNQESGSYRLFMNHDHGIPSGYMNNHRAGTFKKWNGKAIDGVTPISPEALKEKKAVTQKHQDNLYKMRANEFKKEFYSLKPASPAHPYAMKKSLKASFFQRTDVRVDENNNLVLPIKNKQGDITQLQRIWSTGNKQMEKDGKLAESFVKIDGPNKNTSFVMVVEGISTGGTVNDITSIDTYAALTSNNLLNVAKVVQKLHPDKTVVVAGDNDYHLELEDKKNAGVVAGNKAVDAVDGHLTLPPFSLTELSSGRTDWNDFYNDKGFAKTRDALRTAFQKIIDVKKSGPEQEQKQELEVD